MPQFISCAMRLVHTGLAHVLTDCADTVVPLGVKYRALSPTVRRWCPGGASDGAHSFAAAALDFLCLS